MTVAETKEITALMERVKSWPPAMRIALARQILDTLESAPAVDELGKLPRGLSAAEVQALLQTDKSAPDDSTVAQWIDEYRAGKYGQ